MSRPRHRSAIAVATFMLATLCGMVYSAEIERMPLKEIVQTSDIVVVAIADAAQEDKADNGVARYATLRIVQVLKGNEKLSEIEFVTHGSISEGNPNCCEIGSTYLVFAQRRDDGFYESTNGIYGSYFVGKNEVHGWPLHTSDSHVSLHDVFQQICSAEKLASSQTENIAPPSKPPTVIDEGD